MADPIVTSMASLVPLGWAANAPREGRAVANAPPLFEQVFVEVSKTVTPAVVNISTTRVVKEGEESAVPEPFFEYPFFRRFFEPFQNPGIPRMRKELSLGSGVIVDPRATSSRTTTLCPRRPRSGSS